MEQYCFGLPRVVWMTTPSQRVKLSTMDALGLCDRCGTMHGPWGMHAPTNAWQYEVWIDTEGRIQSALSSSGNETSPTQAGIRIVGMLEEFLAKADSERLALNTIVVNLGFDDETGWGPGYGPLDGPAELQRPLEQLISHALSDLQR
jgi:hypothetical protein